jgi:hypothetical protein
MPGRVRDLLIGVEVRPAGRRRKCGANAKHRIPKGEACLVVKREGRGERAYCAECAPVILAHVDNRLSDIRQALDAD